MKTTYSIEQIVVTYNYGEVLRQLRRSRRISQFKLEMAANLQFGTICRIERGKVNPTKETLIKIAIVLQLNSYEVLQLFGLIDFTIYI